MCLGHPDDDYNPHISLHPLGGSIWLCSRHSHKRNGVNRTDFKLKELRARLSAKDKYVFITGLQTINASLFNAHRV